MNLTSNLFFGVIKNMGNFVKTIRGGWLLFATLVIALFTMCYQNNAPVLIVNPYETINWDESSQHKANFHAHTTQTDGNYSPHEVVDKYHQMGYSILSITDHDRVIYPWTSFSELRDDYENRDPDALGMLAVVGNELSRHHHTLSLFTDFKAQSRDLNEVLKNQADHSRDAVAVLAHPAMHWPRQFDTGGVLTDTVVSHYVNYYQRHKHLIGMEIHNGTRPMTEYPLDRALWDSLLTVLMPDRPVWGFATDDLHASVQYGRDWVVLPLADLSTGEARDALKNGAFYFSSIRLSEGDAPNKELTPIIESIVHDRRKGTIKIEARVGGDLSGEESFHWISDGEVIHKGPVLPYKRVAGLGSYVRAEIYGDGGTTYTNPFGFAK